MKANKQINLMMTAVAAVVLAAANVGVFMAAQKGAIAPINNLALWGGFVVLNIVSVLWAISLLGLQPLVVSLSYVVGGYLAFRGVRGMDGINVAEVATAGATYGAFGALAVGNATVKVRLAFFNKGQVPFIFIIIGLLVLDAVLNSGISHADSSVYLNAVVLPFALAGAVVGGTWSVLNRFGIGRKPSEVIAELEAAEADAEQEGSESRAAEKVIIPMPAHAVEAEEEAVPAPAVAAKKKPAPKAKPKAKPAPSPEPVVAEAAAEPVAEENKDEAFFPLEIDNGEAADEPGVDLPDLAALLKAEKAQESESFASPSYDSGFYGSADRDGGVMVEEPAVAVSLDLDAEPEAPVEAEARPEPAAKSGPAPKEQEEKKEAGDDWLGGHLELLNKLK